MIPQMKFSDSSFKAKALILYRFIISVPISCSPNINDIVSMFSNNSQSPVTFYYHGNFNDFSIDLKNSEKFSKCQMQFSQNHDASIKTQVTRFEQASDIIILPACYLNGRKDSKRHLFFSLEAFRTFWYLLMSPFTMVLIVSSQRVATRDCLLGKYGLTDTNLKRLIKNTPAFKVTFSANNDDEKLVANVICNKYCASSDIILRNTNFMQSKAYILGLHRKYFYNGHNQEFSAQITWSHKGLYQESKTKRFLCDQIYQNRQYDLLASAKFCWGLHRSAIELSKHFNVSFKKTKSLKGPYFQSMSQTIKDLEDFKVYWFGGTHLLHYSGWYYIYCQDFSGTLAYFRIDYQVWAKPVTIAVWCMLAFSWVCSTLVLLRLQNSYTSIFEFVHTLIKVFYLGTKCPVKITTSRCACLFFVLGGMSFWTRYEMELGSSVTVQDQPKSFATLVDLFDHGYKIKFTGHCFFAPSTYSCVGEKSDPNYVLNFVTRKATYKVKGRWLNWYIQKDRSTYRKISSAIQCFYVPEEQDMRAFFFVAYTVNRHWMLETLKRIDQAGLVDMWDNLAKFSESNQNREVFIEPPKIKLPDLIGFERILAVLCLIGVLTTVVVIVFFIELLWYYVLSTLIKIKIRDYIIFGLFQAQSMWKYIKNRWAFRRNTSYSGVIIFTSCAFHCSFHC